jgi:prepilin-type N-terminal cleavage/methylation domain-containing protein
MKSIFLVKNKSAGFTLIELLVVVAIIGLLASVVLASLSSARTKAKDASIKESMHQFALLLELNYSDVGSYSNLQAAGWSTTVATCNTLFSGTYAANARQICGKIVTDMGGLGFGMYTGNSSDNNTKFSIMAYLPGKGTYFCVGSSGGTSDTDVGGFSSSGCFYNP